MTANGKTEPEKPMMLSKRVGTLLQEAREARKLTVKDVSRETNIRPQYIEALEKEDYGHFPGETYALGFLRNYAEYLNLDTDHLLNLYRGLQIDQSPAPIQELIKPPRSFGFTVPRINRNLLYAVLSIVLVVGIGYLGYALIPDWIGSGEDEVVQSPCEERGAQDIDLPQQGAPPRSVDLPMNGLVRFQADGLAFKLCIEKIRRDQALPVVDLALVVNNEDVYHFTASFQETKTLNDSIDELSDLRREIRITPSLISDYSARLEFESEIAVAAVDNNGEQSPDLTQSNIQVSLEFTGPSWVEWYRDGDRFERDGTVGTVLTLEAQNRLDIKIGNGGGVLIRREGFAPRRAGQPGQIVRLTYSMVADPLDPTQMRVQESIQQGP